MNTDDFLEYLKSRPYYQNQLVHIRHIPPRRARYGTLKHGLPETLVSALEAQGTRRLFSHQAQAINAVRAGAHIVVATGTASGKTLCYNIPVLDSILTDYRTRALYLFPTKALANDQLRSLRALTRPFPQRLPLGAYDGDTPKNQRSRLREEAAIILTNPDMLHLAILPNHHLWAGFFRHLRYVVLDEAHTYRGVFGAHVAVVLRRLHRLCEHYGSQPQFIACSATIANPGEHVARLTGHAPTVIDQDGAPKAGKRFALWNPPFTDAERTTRRSAYGEAAALFADMARTEIRNITFTRARVTAELILRYARTALRRDAPHLQQRVTSYRAGYLANHRREVEASLSSGALIGVTSTNALELGVDVGGLDATVSVGYPGSIASLWQQAGRAGRQVTGRGRGDSLAILVALNTAIDQYFMRNPDELLGRPSEHALIDPGNLYVLLQHLPCAAHELPLTPLDEARFGPGFVQAMIELETSGQMVYQPERDSWLYMGSDYPAQRVNIRSVGQRPLVLKSAVDGRRLEVMDAAMAPARAHPGAVYIHQGEPYVVQSLDFSAGEALLRPAEVDYFTQTREINDIRIVEVARQQVYKRAVVYWGTVRVTQRVVAYRKIRHLTERKSKEIELDLPPNSFQTRALWWSLPKQWQKAVARRGWRFSGGLYGIEHAMTEMLPLFAMCDRLDVGSHTTLNHPETGLSHVFIYDAHPGGVGISEQGYNEILSLWRATLSTVKDCLCEFGCPSCIYSHQPSGKNEVLDKRAAIWILEALLR